MVQCGKVDLTQQQGPKTLFLLSFFSLFPRMFPSYVFDKELLFTFSHYYI